MVLLFQIVIVAVIGESILGARKLRSMDTFRLLNVLTQVVLSFRNNLNIFLREALITFGVVFLAGCFRLSGVRNFREFYQVGYRSRTRAAVY